MTGGFARRASSGWARNGRIDKPDWSGSGPGRRCRRVRRRPARQRRCQIPRWPRFRAPPGSAASIAVPAARRKVKRACCRDIRMVAGMGVGGNSIGIAKAAGLHFAGSSLLSVGVAELPPNVLVATILDVALGPGSAVSTLESNLGAGTAAWGWATSAPGSCAGPAAAAARVPVESRSWEGKNDLAGLTGHRPRHGFGWRGLFPRRQNRRHQLNVVGLRRLNLGATMV